MLKNIVWFQERPISEITLGGLLILVLVRTIQYNMTRLRVRTPHALHCILVGKLYYFHNVGCSATMFVDPMFSNQSFGIFLYIMWLKTTRFMCYDCSFSSSHRAVMARSDKDACWLSWSAINFGIDLTGPTEIQTNSLTSKSTATTDRSPCSIFFSLQNLCI